MTKISMVNMNVENSLDRIINEYFIILNEKMCGVIVNNNPPETKRKRCEQLL